ncbi:MAG: biotin/lipoyl-containing protein, partial [Myxococcota bacterium]
MEIEVKLPELGESLAEATVGPWLVKEGDRVTADQPLVEIITDKADAELPAPSAGVVEKILVAEGDVIAVGTTVCRIEAEAGAQVAPAPPRTDPAQARRQPRATPVAQRAAREAGVDLGVVPGTGVGGRVTREDVRREVETPASPQPTAPSEARPRPPYAHYDLEPG